MLPRWREAARNTRIVTEKAMIKRVLTTVALAGLAAPLGATTIGFTPNHDQRFAVCETHKLTDYVNNMWAELNDREEGEDRFITWDNFDIYTDRLGRVGSLTSKKHSGKALPSHEYDFVENLRMSFGKEDEGPIKAHRLVRLQKGKKYPVYLFQFERNQWKEYSILLGSDEIESEARYEVTHSTWLVQFQGNQINTLRQAEELSVLASKGRNLLRDRDIDCKALWAAQEDED